MTGYKLQDLIDLAQIKKLSDSLAEAFAIDTTIMDNNGNVLVSSRQQDICTRFRCVCSASLQRCRTISSCLTNGRKTPSADSSGCPFGMPENETPVIVDGKQMGKVLVGPLFVGEPDMNFFSARARDCGLDEDAYLEAIRGVPIVSRRQLERNLAFVRTVAGLLGEMGTTHLRALEAEKKIDRFNEELEQWVERRTAELRASEEKSRQNYEQYRVLFNNASDGIIILDLQGHIIAANPVFCRRMGYREDELIGKTPSEFDAPEYAPLVPLRFKELAEKGAALFESAHVANDGTVIPVEISSKIVHFAEKNVVMSIVRDITERKRDEQVIFEQQRRYQGIYEYSNDAVFLVRVEADGRYVYEGNNPAHQMATGLSSDVLRNRTPYDIVPAPIAGVIAGNYDRCIQMKDTIVFEEELDLPAGRRNWLTHLVPIPGLGGRIDLIAGIARDITCEKVAALALQKSEERFRTLIEKAPEAIVLFDVVTNRIVMANANAERLFGCSRDELLTTHLLQFYAPEQPDGRPPAISFYERYKQVLTEDEVVFERLIKNRQGKEFLCEVRLVRMPSDEAGLVRASYIDITERKRAQAELLAALDLERRINEEQRQFLGLISHELRTPLAVIDGAAQLILLKSDDRTDCFKEAGRIHAATVRLADLIDTCLTDERLATAGWLPVKRREDIALLAGKAADRAQAGTAAHVIECDLAGLPEQYVCDAMLVKVMISNLLDNAIKYSPKGGSIRLRGWSGNGGGITFEVTDQGIGITAAHRDKVFERFYRVSQDSGIAGAGLGLYLVKRIAELHGGGVACSSMPGRGSTFTAWLTAGS